MGLAWCENCQSLEGDTILSPGEDKDGNIIDEHISGIEVCAECGEEITNVPEHDDYDMER